MVLNGHQEAVFTTSTLPQGSHKITANYNPLPNFLATPSATVTEQILDGPQILTAQASAPPGAPSSLALTFNQPLSGVTAQDAANGAVSGNRSTTQSARHHNDGLNLRPLTMIDDWNCLVAETGVDSMPRES